MRPKLAVELLLDYFEQHFLPGLLKLDPNITAALRHCQCEVEIEGKALEINGRLPNFFNGLWRAANDGGAMLPDGLDWGKCYRLFRKELDDPCFLQRVVDVGFSDIELRGKRTQTAVIRLVS